MRPVQGNDAEGLHDGDQTLLAAYRRASRDEPSEAVDAALLAAARRAAGAGPRSGGRFRLGRWNLPMAMAATVVMSATVVFMAVREQGFERLSTAPEQEAAHEAPSAAHQAPAAAHQAPAAAHQAPAVAHQAPAVAHQAPSAAQQAPATPNQRPAAANERESRSDHAPATISAGHESPVPPVSLVRGIRSASEFARAKEAETAAMERTAAVAARDEAASQVRASKADVLRKAPQATPSSIIPLQEDVRIAREQDDGPRPAAAPPEPVAVPSRPAASEAAMNLAEMPAAGAGDTSMADSEAFKMEAGRRADALGSHPEKRVRQNRAAAAPAAGAAAEAAPAAEQDARIERIRRLLREGRRVEARELLVESRRNRPDQILPPDLLELAREAGLAPR